jgi:hypothetical protein
MIMKNNLTSNVLDPGKFLPDPDPRDKKYRILDPEHCSTD